MSFRPETSCLPLAVVLATCLDTAHSQDAPTGEPVGKRPYEMVWAGRESDDHPPLIDFETPVDWRVTCEDAEATFTRSREQIKPARRFRTRPQYDEQHGTDDHGVGRDL